MNNSHITPEELAALACGEIEEPRASELHAALAADTDLKAQFDQFADALSALNGGAGVSPAISSPSSSSSVRPKGRLGDERVTASSRSGEGASDTPSRISPASPIALSEDSMSQDFNSRLRAAFLHESAITAASPPSHAPSPELAPAPTQTNPTRLRIWSLVPWAAAAAVIVFVIFGPSRFPWQDSATTGGGGVVWAQVLEAVKKVNHFHLTAFGDDRQAGDGSSRLIRADIFFKSPDTWRGQGMGLVHFARADQSRKFSAEKLEFLDPNKPSQTILQPEFLKGFREKGLLFAVLSPFFEGQLPQGEPAKNDEAAGQGVEVFDYAQDATQRWVRVWVLKESKLPIRVNIYMPESDETIMVMIDYADPQPDTFFDADQFAREIKDRNLRKENEIFGVGMKPISGNKPQNAGQIYDTKGYRAPIIRNVELPAYNNTWDGILNIITDSPKNQPPAGVYLSESKYMHVTDNWGNQFVLIRGGPTGVGEGDNSIYRFSAIPPFKTGAEPHILKADFVLRTSQTSGDKLITLKTETISLPAPAPGTRGSVGADAQRFAVRQFMLINSPLRDQFAAIEYWSHDHANMGVSGWRAAHADTENDPFLIQWRVILLRQHHHEEAAWKLFDEKLRDWLIETAPIDNLVAQYLIRLAATDQWAEYDKYSAKVVESWNKLVAAQPAKEGIHYEQSIVDGKLIPVNGKQTLLENQHLLITKALNLRKVRESLEKLPTVSKVVITKDGYIGVKLNVTRPSDYWQGFESYPNSLPPGWTYDGTHLPNSGWEVRQRFLDEKTLELFLAFRLTGNQPVTPMAPFTITLGGQVVLLRDNYDNTSTHNEVTQNWKLDIPITPAGSGSADTISGWWKSETKKDWSNWPDYKPEASPVNDWLNQAATEVQAGKWAAAVDLYRKVLAAPNDQWLSYTRLPENGGLSFQKRLVRIDLISALAALDRINEADAEVKLIAPNLPAKPDHLDFDQVSQRMDVWAAKLSIAKRQIATQHFDDAAARLNDIEKDRPNLALIDDVRIDVVRGQSHTSWWPRSKLAIYWRAIDSALLDLTEAQEAAK